MTGIAPFKSGYYMHDRNFRLYPSLTNAVTLPQQLKANGYFTTGVGKLFHTGQGHVNGPVGQDWADARNSWSVWVNHAIGCNGGQPGRFSPPNGGLMQFGPSRLRLEQSGDWLVADYTARLLANSTAAIGTAGGESTEQAVTLPKDKPFFVGCGLFRPHLPFYAPEEFFIKFPPEEMTGLTRDELEKIIADLNDIPKDGLRFSDLNNGKMKEVMDNARKIGGDEAQVAAWRDLVQAYLACVSFADACVGRLLDGLERSPHKTNTVVILWSDHGFHVGSKYHVAKQALWEEANRTELIIRDPRSSTASNGKLRRQIVSLNDIFPTICALANVPLPKTFEVGKDLSPLLANADAPELHDELLMTYMAGNHSLRTPQYRFMRYNDGGMELYDMLNDPRQITNLVNTAALDPVREKFAAALAKRVAGQIMPGRKPSAADNESDNDADGPPRNRRNRESSE
jgi:arylsulfatase A-like enzyme